MVGKMKQTVIASIIASLVPLAMAYLQYLEKIEVARVMAVACTATVEGLVR